jgi:hypothetical protein
VNERALSYPPSPPASSRRLGWLAAALGLLLAGCPEPGDLEQVGSYCKPGEAMVGANNQVVCSQSSGTGGGSGAGCESSCLTTLLTNSCISCHQPPAAQGNLDLKTAGLDARLKDQPAQHAGLATPQGCPSGDKLVDSANQDASWLLKKIKSQQNGCGTPMPPALSLTADEITCVTTYVACLSMTP